MSLSLYNTLTRQKEEFAPFDKSEVKLYTCGPTVYDFLTIGNLRSFLFADVLHRALLYNGYQVKKVMNITDVGHLTGDRDMGEDKLEKGAKKLGKTAWEVAEMFTQVYHQDVTSLNILPPILEVKATDHIDDQIAFIKVLEEKGFTYKTSDGIYFDSSKISSYGELANLDIENLKEGARVEVNSEKKSPTDFALWKFHTGDGKRDMEWASPWGKGFPGWHIECSAMGTKYLGEMIDIHTGGVDHIPIHHTNERAQNLAYFDKPVVNSWMHCAFINVDDKRIGKSEGNAILLTEFSGKGFSPLAYRYFLLQGHYRSQMNFTWDGLLAAATAYNKLIRQLTSFTLEAKEAGSEGTLHGDTASEFLEAINDDLNTAKALAIVWDLMKTDAISNIDKLNTILHFDKALGLRLAETINERIEEQELIPAEVHKLAQEREVARIEKDFPRADEIRDEINNLGYFLEDTEDGPELVKKL